MTLQGLEKRQIIASPSGKLLTIPANLTDSKIFGSNDETVNRQAAHESVEDTIHDGNGQCSPSRGDADAAL